MAKKVIHSQPPGILRPGILPDQKLEVGVFPGEVRLRLTAGRDIGVSTMSPAMARDLARILLEKADQAEDTAENIKHATGGGN